MRRLKNYNPFRSFLFDVWLDREFNDNLSNPVTYGINSTIGLLVGTPNYLSASLHKLGYYTDSGKKKVLKTAKEIEEASRTKKYPTKN